MRILIADDDCISRHFLESHLTEWGHEAVVARDGKQAWQILQAPDAPAMVILDWLMPGMDGVEVCLNLRTVQREVRPYVILLTSKGQKKDLVLGISSGADDYLSKPCDPDELRARIYAGQRILDLQLESLMAMASLRKQATHDHLTGLANRVSIMKLLQQEMDRSLRTGTDLSIIMADVDRFKEINDTFGHQAGDAVLTETAKRLALAIRSYEHIGRYGGEEFLAVLSPCDERAAAKLAERLRLTVMSSPITIGAKSISVTASFGVVSTTQMTDPSQELLIEMADSALYRAKRGGRNRVELAPTSTACAPP